MSWTVSKRVNGTRPGAMHIWPKAMTRGEDPIVRLTGYFQCFGHGKLAFRGQLAGGGGQNMDRQRRPLPTVPPRDAEAHCGA